MINSHLTKYFLEIYFVRQLDNYHDFNFRTSREMKKFIKRFRKVNYIVEKDGSIIVFNSKWYIFNEMYEQAEKENFINKLNDNQLEFEQIKIVDNLTIIKVLNS